MDLGSQFLNRYISSFSLFHTLSLSLFSYTLSPTNTHPCSLSHTHILSNNFYLFFLSLSLSLSLLYVSTHTHSCSLSLKRTHTLSHINTIALSHKHSHILSLSYIYSRTQKVAIKDVIGACLNILETFSRDKFNCFKRIYALLSPMVDKKTSVD